VLLIARYYAKELPASNLLAVSGQPAIGNRYPLSAYGSRLTAPRCSTGASEANSVFFVYRFPGHE